VSEKRFRIAFEINVRAPWDLVQRVVPDMIERGGGSIVNISSAGAKHPEGPPFQPHDQFGGHTLYGATKAALDRISCGLAAELYVHGIRVNSLAPVAAVMTPGVEALGVVPDEFRASAEPVEALAEATLALCEDSDAPVTGRVLASLPFLEEIGRPIRSLDGRSVLEESS
jgi:NAD(P)-dependent dehydrogenase (short-subunit alcohol dehydrogenase family)